MRLLNILNLLSMVLALSGGGPAFSGRRAMIGVSSGCCRCRRHRQVVSGFGWGRRGQGAVILPQTLWVHILLGVTNSSEGCMFHPLLRFGIPLKM